MFSEGPSFLFTFHCNGVALDSLRHVVYLSVSMTMSRPAETGKKFEHVKYWIPNSGFAKSQPFWSDFLFLSFVKFNFYCLQGRYSLGGSRDLVSLWSFLKDQGYCFYSFFVSNLQTVFPLKPVISEGPSFFVLFVCNDGDLNFSPARGSPASASDHVMTSQDYIKVEHVRTWLHSSSFSKFQQFWSECFLFKFLV